MDARPAVGTCAGEPRRPGQSYLILEHAAARCKETLDRFLGFDRLKVLTITVAQVPKRSGRRPRLRFRVSWAS